MFVAISAYSAYRLLNTADGLTAFNSALVKLPTNKTLIQTAQYERKIYPYSIVRGGMGSREEVYANIRTDHVVAEHYSDFDVNQTRIIQAPETRQMYVSYRLGDEVYWTANAITIPQGETLITDGIIEARTRCGNRISATPMTPTSDEEPDVAFFDIPENEIPGYSDPDQTIVSEQTPLTQLGDAETPMTRGPAPRGMLPGGSSGQYLPGSPVSLIPPGNTVPLLPEGPGVPREPNLPGEPDVPGRPSLPGGPDLPGGPGGPDLPGLPDLPGRPDLPGLPDLPGSNTVPEPSTMVMLLTGLATVAFIGIRRKKQ